MTRVVFCWSAISGYMAACWRTLAMEPGINVHVLGHVAERESEFDARVMDGVAWECLERQGGGRLAAVRRALETVEPDVLVLAGWSDRYYRQVGEEWARRGRPLVLCMDNAWTGSLRQRLGRVAHRRLLRSVTHVVVPGERAFQHALHLGFAEDEISRGLYGYDNELFKPTNEPRGRAFGFAGQYREYKGFDILVDAYRRYRSRVSCPWDLVCVGKGPLGTALGAVAGGQDRGFLQPAEVAKAWQSIGAFVLPSRWESWGVALAEACGTGLPVLCTNGVGASVELVRDQFNGLVVRSASVEALARGMEELHHAESQLTEMGERSVTLAAPFAATNWARRWVHVCRRLANRDAVRRRACASGLSSEANDCRFWS